MKVLISAYACEPAKGSEPGAGWNWAQAAARSHEVWVLTRTNNREPIERALASSGRGEPTFVYLDLPSWARFWKRGRVGLHLYYAIWQLLAGRAARRLEAEHRFDVVHHVTFANAWLPAFACLADAPFVLGPVGGGPRIPLRMYPALGPRGAAFELVRSAARGVTRLSPLVRVGWKRAVVILAQNEETRAALPRRYRAKTVIRPHASVADDLAVGFARTNGRSQVVCAGRLLPWKGIALAIQALAHLPDWELVIVGRGPDEKRLRRVAARLGLDDRTRFVPWLAQDELWQTISAARALVLPSLRDDSPLVAAEALTLGVPVVAFDQGGPAAFAAAAGDRLALVPLRSRDESARGLAAALELVAATAAGPAPDFGIAAIARELDAIYQLARAGAGR